MMSSVSRKFGLSRLLLVLPVCILMTGCIFGGKKGLTAEELAARVTINPFEEKLTPDPTLAATTVALPDASPAGDWLQSGLTASKSPGHLTAAPEFKVAWKAQVAGSSELKRIVASPVVKGERVYVIDANQRVSAFSTQDGKLVWKRDLVSENKKWDTYSVGGGLAISGDKLIVASGYSFVEAMNVDTGATIWRRKVDAPMSGSPAIMGNRAYVTSTNNEFYCIDIDTGEIVWSDQAIAETARVLSSPSPAVNADLLVVPYSSGELIAYLPANGKRLWADTLSTGGRYTPLSVINDIAGRPVIQDGVVYAASHSGVLAAIDARSGSRMWDANFGSRQGPMVEGQFVFMVGIEGKVVCFNKLDGKIVWVRALPEFKNMNDKKDRIVWVGPLVASNRLVVGGSDGRLVAISPQTGANISELRLNDPIYIEPIAAAGKIFILSDRGSLIAIK